MEYSSATSTATLPLDCRDHSTAATNATAPAEGLGGAAELNLPYAVCEILVAVCAVIGNGLVVTVFARERKLRRRTNYYIISLAAADLLVGLFAVPFAILASIGLPTNLYACLFTVSVLVVLCTISIFCLVAVSVDRYWAILHPMGYSRAMRTKTAIGIICACWAAGTLVGFLPLLGWNAGKKSDEKCIFVEVMDYDYLVFLYFATIISPALLIGAFYAHIYRVVVKQLQQMVTMNPGGGTGNQTAGTMLRLLGAAQKREVKATQNLFRIVIFFIICWFPLYTINCVKAFCPDCEVNDVLLDFCIILSHLNSVGNPLLYAYHLKDFRAALKNFIYRLLFPNSDVKASMVSVIHDRISLGSQHNAHRVGATSRIEKPSCNRRAIEQPIPRPTPVLNSPVLQRGDEPVITPVSSPSDRREIDAFVSYNVSPISSELRPNDESLSTNGRSGCETSGSETPSKVPSLELQTYRPFAQLFGGEVTEEEEEEGEEEKEETSPESVFVIEADINRAASLKSRVALDDKSEGKGDSN